LPDIGGVMSLDPIKQVLQLDEIIRLLNEQNEVLRMIFGKLSSDGVVEEVIKNQEKMIDLLEDILKYLKKIEKNTD
jgi:hypothetical protein